jgi:hypothetical protein
VCRLSAPDPYIQVAWKYTDGKRYGLPVDRVVRGDRPGFGEDAIAADGSALQQARLEATPACRP